ncbi:hypothetical protein Xbed_01811 [Xenorhabdus beddingii]|uniref:GTP-binding protein YdgA n=1 Tax=Xenorhabdus beddingii TaxID=40578 RepID=A0A1Y2SQM3_9GAMM|nr:YdgA family protein [Xenorhabdus beddingii]OTA20095.1 hypothetical protein Xbed_01811 [Xenorhabdus beddingii]
MKKSLVAVSVVVALGAVWTGASWYTGKQLEGRLDHFISKANTELKEAFPESGIEWQAENFKRGVFSSDVRLILSIKGTKSKSEEIIFKSTIDHGPFPVSSLKRFNLMPKMASIHSELEQSEPLKDLFNLTQGKSPLNINAEFSYGGSLSSNINLSAVNHTETKENGEKRVLSFSGAQINAETDRHLNAFSFSVKSDALSFSDPTKKESIILKDIDFKGNGKKGLFDIYIGDQSYGIGEISTHGIAGESDTTETNDTAFKGLKITSNLTEDKDNLNIKIGYSIDGIKVKNMDFGSGKIVLGMEKLDGESVRKFTQAYNDTVAAETLTTHGSSYDITYAAVLSNLHLLLNKDPQFSLSPFSWKNSKGESTVDFKLSLQNIPEDKNALLLMEPEEVIRTLIQSLSLHINVPKAMLVESITQADVLGGEDKTAAEAKAKQQVNTLAQEGIKLNVLTDENDVIGLNFHYADDKVKLNSKETSLHQFLLDNGLVGSYDDADGEQNQHDDAETPVTE